MTKRCVLAVMAMAMAVPAIGADPKAKKFSISDPAEAAKNADFQTQGEYEGTLTYKDQEPEKLGAQVIARGDGKFEAVFYRGGLPGAGWDGEDKLTFEGKRDGDAVALTGKAPGGVTVSGQIANGKITMKDSEGDGSVSMKKVTRKSDTLGAKAPEGAIVLFDGSDVSEWQGGKFVELSDGKFLGVGTKSKQKFGDGKIHLEFRLAFMPNATGQARSNSGVYVQDRYECQVLDSFGLKGADNECGGFYKQAAPSVNMCLPPLQWQTYDIDFTAAKFDDAGKKTSNARATVYLNGVKIHDDVEFTDATAGGQKEAPTPGPIQLQNHGDPLVYRNIWVLPKK